MKRTNQKRSGNNNVERPVGKSIRIGAVYSSKHNTIDFNKVFDQKMEEWEGLSIVKAKDIVEPFGYQSEAYKVPDNYYYGEKEFNEILEANSKSLVLYFRDMTNNLFLNSIEEAPYVAYCYNPKNEVNDTLFIRNYLNYDEGLLMTKGVSMDDDEDLDKISKDPSATEDLFHGIIAKKKLKDLVIDTCYKVAFNKAIETHYVNKNSFHKNIPITILKYFNDPVTELFGYGKTFGAVYIKTKLDPDGDREIETVPKAKYVIIEKEDGFLFKSLTEFNDDVEVRSVKDLEAFPNLMIPEDFLRKLVIKDFLNTRKDEDNRSKDENVNSSTSNSIYDGVSIVSSSAVITLVKDNSEIRARKLGIFRAPRNIGEVSEIVTHNQFCSAKGPNDLWILIDEKVEKIYFYNSYNNRIVDWCFATTIEFTSILEKFDKKYLSEGTKAALIDNMNNTRINSYSELRFAYDVNKGLGGFLKNCK